MPVREFSQLRVSLSSGNLRATLVQYPLLMAELDAIRKLRPTGGLMLRRDGSSLPWFGKGEILTGPADFEEGNPGSGFAARTDLHLVRLSRRHN